METKVSVLEMLYEENEDSLTEEEALELYNIKMTEEDSWQYCCMKGYD